MSGEEFTRRGFLELTGATGLAALSDGSVTNQLDATDVDTSVEQYGLLLGANPHRPSQAELEEKWDTYHFVFKATDTGAEYEIRHTDNGWNLLPMSLEQYEDAFGIPVFRNETNDGDLAAHYPYTPERFRYYVDGSRQFIQYAADPLNPSGIPYQFQRDSHLLSVPAGSTVNWRTAETWRYVVQYVKSVSAALETARTLTTNEYVMMGPYFGVDANYDPDYGNYGDPAEGTVGAVTDGWAIKFSGQIAGDGSQVELLEARDGTVLDSYIRDTENLLTEWSRWNTNYNYYNVGPAVTEQTVSRERNDGTDYQLNEEIGATSAVRERGPLLGNKPFILEAHATGTTLDVDMGSVGVLTKGDVTPKVRSKTATLEATIESGTDWEPAAAIRIRPELYHANVQVVDMVAISTPGAAEIKLQAVDPSKVQDSGGAALTDADFSAANIELSDANNALQGTGADVVEAAPDQNGTVSSSGITVPGGYQVNKENTAEKNAKANAENASEAKRAIYGGDYGVVYIKGSAGTYRIDIATEQEY